ncbi:MAG: hypothetical protein JST92_17585, partial [Deltaproteobacteria bacterium]|nr:hypothetical protein [Deltaproteobacteria bacterium]
MPDARQIRSALTAKTLTPAQALDQLLPLAHGAPLLLARVEAHQLLGELAGRAFETPWELAERAAFALLELVRRVEGRSERRALLLAVGRGHRNLWLMPYVHARLDDHDP